MCISTFEFNLFGRACYLLWHTHFNKLYLFDFWMQYESVRKQLWGMHHVHKGSTCFSLNLIHNDSKPYSFGFFSQFSLVEWIIILWIIHAFLGKTRWKTPTVIHGYIGSKVYIMYIIVIWFPPLVCQMDNYVNCSHGYYFPDRTEPKVVQIMRIKQW